MGCLKHSIIRYPKLRRYLQLNSQGHEKDDELNVEPGAAGWTIDILNFEHRRTVFVFKHRAAIGHFGFRTAANPVEDLVFVPDEESFYATQPYLKDCTES